MSFAELEKKNIKPCADTLSVDMKKEGKSSMCFAELKHKESTRDIERERERERIPYLGATATLLSVTAFCGLREEYGEKQP